MGEASISRIQQEMGDCCRVIGMHGGQIYIGAPEEHLRQPLLVFQMHAGACLYAGSSQKASRHGRVEQGRTPKSGNLPTMTWISLPASNGRATATRTKVLLFTSPSRTPGWFVCI